MAAECPCCGQTMPPRVDLGIKLSHMQQRIVDRVHRAGQHGILSTDLMDWLYADDLNGGPDSGRKCLSALICQLNKKLAKAGKRICAPVGGHRYPTAYVFESINA